jgi:acetyl-CoA acetyltransferase
MLDDASITEDAILEPVIDQGITRTVSDVLLGIHTPSEEEDAPSLAEVGHDKELPGLNDTYICDANDQTGTVTHETNSSVSTLAALLLSSLDTSTWKTLRLTNRAWYFALEAVAPPKFPASYRLPVEASNSCTDLKHTLTSYVYRFCNTSTTISVQRTSTLRATLVEVGCGQVSIRIC